MVMEEKKRLYLGQADPEHMENGSFNSEETIEEMSESYFRYCEEEEKRHNEEVTMYGEETARLLAVFERAVDRLRNDGVCYDRIWESISECGITAPIVSISEDYRIFITHGDTDEITLDPLTKALYFLFLRNYKGLYRSHLPEHRDELVMIYKTITKTDVLSTAKNRAIDSLLDPTGNSFNVSCNRIKKEFLKFLDADVAEQYYISGEQGELKSILMWRACLEVSAAGGEMIYLGQVDEEHPEDVLYPPADWEDYEHLKAEWDSIPRKYQEYDEVTEEQLVELNMIASELRDAGVSLECLMGKVNPYQVDSPEMTVTRDYRIIVHGNEVVLDPLTKSLYFLFLRNVRGLWRTELPEHRDELVMIYKAITGKTKLSTAKNRAIDSLLDPTGNSFNVSCNRIKKEFLKFLDADVAEQYYISGGQGQRKIVYLFRELLNVE